MPPRRAILLPAALLAACGDPAPVERAAAVTGGTPAAGDPAVVAIAPQGGDPGCTGTLIAPRVVLTAAHCGVPPARPWEFRAFFGADAGGVGAWIDLVDARTHPAFDPVELSNDLALLFLGGEPPASPAPVGALEGAGIGDPVRIVGFGATAAGAADQGVKREGTARIAGLDAGEVRLEPDPSQPCKGDSGGPIFRATAGTERLVAVISHGDAACQEGSTGTRVDAHLASFVDPYLAETAPGVRAVGERCLYDGHCASGDCHAAEDDPRVTYCASPCAGHGDCPDGMRCARRPGGDDACLWPTPTPGALGAACDDDGDCVGSTCVAALGVCSRRCVPDGQADCPAGFACRAVASPIDFWCVADPPAGSGLCAAAPGGVPGRHGRGGALLLGALAAAALAGRRRRGR